MQYITEDLQVSLLLHVGIAWHETFEKLAWHQVGNRLAVTAWAGAVLIQDVI